MDSSYQSPAPDPGAGYQPMQPGYTPPQKKGFNWLACCGISCGVMLVLVIIVTLIGINMGKKFMATFQPMIEASEELENTSIEDIRAQAVAVDAEELAANPGAYEGQWLAVEGEVMDPNEFVDQYYANDQGTTEEMRRSISEEGTTYMLRGGILLTDTSNAPSQGTTGEWVRGYGKVFQFDMADIPMIGQLIKQEMGENSMFKFFVAKEVEALEGGSDGMDEGGEGEAEGGESAEGGSGDAPPADGGM